MEQTIINSDGYSIFIGNNLYSTIKSFLLQYEFKGNKVFLLVDRNSRKYCLPILMSNVQLFQKVFVLEIEGGEETKTIETASFIWQKLADKNADRNSILINLGGGMVTDIGGFVASTFQRGIRYLNIPTTLLGMADASIGGKVGMDLQSLKNQIGLFSNPQTVFILPEFIETLPPRQIRAGFTEIIKHAIIYKQHYWEELTTRNFSDIHNWDEIISWSIEIKNYFVMEDPLDTGFRKVLNYGHTIGHAIETFSLQNDEDPLIHGEAVAIGLICESYISHKKAGLMKTELDEISTYILSAFEEYPLRSENFDFILDVMKHDKKNTGDKFNFTLLTSIGDALINQDIGINLIMESLHYYQNLFR